jgi:NitT/TauT family transport system permease protein
VKKDLLLAFSPNQAVSKKTLAILAIIYVLALLVSWQTMTSPIIPKPREVLAAFGTVWNQGAGMELWQSFSLTLEALAISTLLSLGLAYLTVFPAMRPIVEVATKGRYLGLVGLTFLFTLMSKDAHQLKVMLLVFGTSVFLTTSMADVVAGIPKEKFDYARTLRMKEWRVVAEVVMYGKLDEAIEMVRQNFAICWMMLTMVEGIARSEGGVGAMLLNQNKHFHLAEVFAIQLMILGIGLLCDYGIGVLKNIICPYASLTVERR